MEESGHLRNLAALPLEKSPWYTLDGRLGKPKSQPQRCGEEKNLCREWNPYSSVVWSVV